MFSTRIGTDDIEVANPRVDVYSCRGQLSYPWGNFSLITCPHKEGTRWFAKPCFRICVDYCPQHSQVSFCSYTLRRISDPPELTFGGSCLIFGSVAPHPNCPPIVVPLTRLVTQFLKGSVSSLPPPRPKLWLRRLLPTLRNRNRITATGCSKAPRGLRFHVGETGLCTSTLISRG